MLHQEAVGQHDQGQVPVEDAVQPLQAVPAPALAASPHLRKVAQPLLAFGIFVELLDDPPAVRQGNKALQGSRVLCYSQDARAPRGQLRHTPATPMPSSSHTSLVPEKVPTPGSST